jgi:hypothetical protein
LNSICGYYSGETAEAKRFDTADEVKSTDLTRRWKMLVPLATVLKLKLADLACGFFLRIFLADFACGFQERNLNMSLLCFSQREHSQSTSFSKRGFQSLNDIRNDEIPKCDEI